MFLRGLCEGVRGRRGGGGRVRELLSLCRGCLSSRRRCPLTESKGAIRERETEIYVMLDGTHKIES